MPSENTDGINLSATYLTPEIVEQVHAIGKTVGVWLSRGNSFETTELYNKVFGLKVDFVYLDMPLIGMKHRDEFFRNILN